MGHGSSFAGNLCHGNLFGELFRIGDGKILNVRSEERGNSTLVCGNNGFCHWGHILRRVNNEAETCGVSLVDLLLQAEKTVRDLGIHAVRKHFAHIAFALAVECEGILGLICSQAPTDGGLVVANLCNSSGKLLVRPFSPLDVGTLDQLEVGLSIGLEHITRLVPADLVSTANECSGLALRNAICGLCNLLEDLINNLFGELVLLVDLHISMVAREEALDLAIVAANLHFTTERNHFRTPHNVNEFNGLSTYLAKLLPREFLTKKSIGHIIVRQNCLDASDAVRATVNNLEAIISVESSNNKIFGGGIVTHSRESLDELVRNDERHLSW
mmetsp:Transcript_15654/g.27407  ORF Transcript_15654/g.27407 Transcript_15654/m.27407 type:complete len:329 (-) Transcript_15654:266-1252(-)